MYAVIVLVFIGVELSAVHGDDICGRPADGAGKIEEILKSKDAQVVVKSQPWLVQILNGQKLTCTGVLVHGSETEGNTATSFFISSYNCEDEIAESTSVIVGSMQLQIIGWTVIGTVNKDRTVVARLGQIVQFNGALKPICLNPAGSKEATNNDITVLAKFMDRANGQHAMEISKLDPLKEYIGCEREANNVCHKAGKGSPMIVYNMKMFAETAYLHGLVSNTPIPTESGKTKLPYADVPPRVDIEKAMEQLTTRVPESIKFDDKCYGSLVRVGAGKGYTVAVTNSKCAQTHKEKETKSAVLYDGKTKVNVLDFAIHDGYTTDRTKHHVAVVKLGHSELFKISGGGYRLPEKSAKLAGLNGFIVHVTSGQLNKAPVKSLPKEECEMELEPLIGLGSNEWMCFEITPGKGLNTGMPFYIQENTGRKTIGAVTVGNKRYLASVTEDEEWITKKVQDWQKE